MKTIEEKARAYDKVRKKIAIRFGSNVANEFFAEFEESEDEKVRNGLVRLLKELLELGGVAEDEWDRNECEKYIAWLEKQEGCEYIKKDWLEHIKQSWYKEGLIDGKYSGGTSKEWTINDAATLKELIDFLENGTAKLQHDLTRYANWLKNQFTPIIERQGEQNFEMKTAAESLGVDSETYNKIVDECIFGEQKPEENKGNIGGISANPEWSEEDDDDAWMNDIISKVENNLQLNKAEIDWLKSLKLQPKQSLDEDTQQWVDTIIKDYEDLYNTDKDHRATIQAKINILKSLRPQNKWKPSETDIMILEKVFNGKIDPKDFQATLFNVLEQLKKLKEE